MDQSQLTFGRTTFAKPDADAQAPIGVLPLTPAFCARQRQKPTPDAWTKSTCIELPRAFSPTCSKHHIVGRLLLAESDWNSLLQTSLKLVLLTRLQGDSSESRRL